MSRSTKSWEVKLESASLKTDFSRNDYVEALKEVVFLRRAIEELRDESYSDALESILERERLTAADLKWFDSEDGYYIIGTHRREIADDAHDHLVDVALVDEPDIEDFKSKSLNPPQELWLRPDWEYVEDEGIDLRLDPRNGKKVTSESGVPALFYQN